MLTRTTKCRRSKPPPAATFDSSLEDYLAEVNRLWNSYSSTRNVTEFVTGLKAVNEYWLDHFARLGYMSTGGFTEGDIKAADKAIDFINGFADNFGTDLQASPEEDLRWRALMYPREGHRLAYVLGQQEAMRERGAKSWRRVLHPELSESGPCALCIEDSMLTHSMDEDFELLHPGDRCSVMEIISYFAEPPENVVPGEKPVAELPVPGRPTEHNVVQMLKDSLSKLGTGIRHIIRRVRGK